jgi:phosphoribosylamine-glycine ligase
VLDVTALGSDLAHARDRAYEAVALIDWPGMQYRTDIAADIADLAQVHHGGGIRAESSGVVAP